MVLAPFPEAKRGRQSERNAVRYPASSLCHEAAPPFDFTRKLCLRWVPGPVPLRAPPGRHREATIHANDRKLSFAGAA
jgi:hypothetical protein